MERRRLFLLALAGVPLCFVFRNFFVEKLFAHPQRSVHVLLSFDHFQASTLRVVSASLVFPHYIELQRFFAHSL
ncbi:hypothetical protein [Aneurinibacillus migulanus]|uniref:hypothetical protein n=1 Tax=Aneurinibacillus migulanus TaxID=47500 RepID=UPI00209EFF28|nr:hypothetical protein [Aneurinibacillus migulanus]MCP1358938.1 hypothetical protein [Aneurinibacillus migulanus]